MKKLDIIFLYWNSSRASAYINILLKQGLYPKDIIVLNNNSYLNDLLIQEAERYNYSESFFDFNLSYKNFNGYSNIIETDCHNVNDPQIRKELENCDPSYVLFSGGGILKQEILAIDKKFIHIHPGILPNYKGSTCFYYSILNHNSLGATAFFMEESLDTGETICDESFDVNYFIKNDQFHFVDEILDPFIRAQVFEKFLKKYIKTKKVNSYKQKQSNAQPYYVIHPLLRSLAVQKINSFYNSKKPIGIFHSNIKD